MTQKDIRREKVASYLRANPRQRLQYAHIAEVTGMRPAEASIALSALLGPGVMPGLYRVGRGAYEYAPGFPDSEVASAATRFCEAWRGLTRDMPHSFSLTCGEADALAELLIACGDPDTAEKVLTEHGRNDDEGDAHFQLFS